MPVLPYAPLAFPVCCVCVSRGLAALQEHGFRRLCDILECVCGLWQKPARLGFEPQWAAYLRSVPAERVEAMAMRRLDREKEDAPKYSRYLQVRTPVRCLGFRSPCNYSPPSVHDPRVRARLCMRGCSVPPTPTALVSLSRSPVTYRYSRRMCCGV